jgi:ribosomal-protein-alanine N-acetyltransferase
MVNDNASTPGSPVKILPATWRDLGALQHLERMSFPKDSWPLWDLIGILTLPEIVRLKAVLDGRMVGFIASEYRSKEQADWIATIAVLPGYQQRGIGAVLLNACEERTSGLNIRLCVRASNLAAIRLYERSGYYHLRTWSQYYHDGEEAIVMEKRRPEPDRSSLTSAEVVYQRRP